MQCVVLEGTMPTLFTPPQLAHSLLTFPIWLDAMQADSIVLTRVHLKLLDYNDKHHAHQRRDVTDCNARHA